MAASIVAIIDHSASMGIGTPTMFSLAKTDASTFLSLTHVNDQIAALGFGWTASMVYPATQSLVPVTGPTEKMAASQAIQLMPLSGNTNMADAVTMANNLLVNAASPKGAVLLSDGDWNAGSDPRTVANSGIRLFTIALGPISTSGQATLNALATMTGGQYNYVQDMRQLAKIYFAIVNQANIASVPLNQAQPLGMFSTAQLPVTIDGSSSNCAFAVAWEDQSCQFTPSTPVGNQVNVTVQDPNGKIHDQPTEAGPGWCTFNLPTVGGEWNIGIWSAQTNSFYSQAGGFEKGSSVELDVQPTRSALVAGDEFEVTAAVTDEGEPLSGVSVRTRLVSPVASLDEALSLHAERLAAVPDEGCSDGPADDTAVALRRARSLATSDPSFSLLEHRESYVPSTEEGMGAFVVRGAHALTPGSHTLEVTARGSTRAGRPFVRHGHVSVFRQ